MRKLILIAFSLALAASMAAEKAAASAMTVNNNTNPRTFNGRTGLTVAGNLLFEFDFKFPNVAVTPGNNRQHFGITFLSAGTGDNTPYTANSVTPGVGFRVEASPSTDLNGQAETFTLYYRDGLFSVDLAQAQFHFPFDHKWHHVQFGAILAPGNDASGLGIAAPAAGARRPGIIFIVDGVTQASVVLNNIATIGLGTNFSGTIQNFNNAGSGNNNLPLNRILRVDNLRSNGVLLDSFENRVAAPAIAAAINMMNGAAGWSNNAATIAQTVGGQANWLTTVGNVGQYQTDAENYPAGQTDGSAKESDFAQGSIFLNSAAVNAIVAADRSAAAADDLDFTVDFKFPDGATVSTSNLAFSINARMYGLKGQGSYTAATNAPGVECKVSVSADANGFFRAAVIDRTTSNSAAAGTTLVSTRAFNTNWHRLNFRLVGTTATVSIDGVSLGAFPALSAAVAGVNDGENFSIAVNPGTGGSAARNPRIDTVSVASAINPAAFGAAVVIDNYSTYLPQEFTPLVRGFGTLNTNASNLRSNLTQAVLNDTPWINGQFPAATATASNPPVFRMTEDNSNFGLTVNAVPDFTLY